MRFVYLQGHFGIGLVHVLNSTTLRFEYYRTTDQIKHDEVVLTRLR